MFNLSQWIFLKIDIFGFSRHFLISLKHTLYANLIQCLQAQALLQQITVTQAPALLQQITAI